MILQEEKVLEQDIIAIIQVLKQKQDIGLVSIGKEKNV